VAHLRLSHKMDVDIRRLIAEFSDYAEVIAAIVDVE
jgi:hypothetical protein